MNERRNQQSGFTLLELLMVVIIVGILAALALPGYIKAAERSRAAEVKSISGQMKGAMQRYCAENNGVVPTAFTDLDVEDPTDGTINPDLVARWSTALPTGACEPFAVNMAWNRSSGPCNGSVLTYDYPATVAGGDPFTYAWAGPCI